MRINKSSVIRIPDVERNNRVFSDGVGTSENPTSPSSNSTFAVLLGVLVEILSLLMANFVLLNAQLLTRLQCLHRSWKRYGTRFLKKAN